MLVLCVCDWLFDCYVQQYIFVYISYFCFCKVKSILLCNCNRTQIQNQVFCKCTLNYLVRLFQTKCLLTFTQVQGVDSLKTCDKIKLTVALCLYWLFHHVCQHIQQQWLHFLYQHFFPVLVSIIWQYCFIAHISTFPFQWKVFYLTV